MRQHSTKKPLIRSELLESRMLYTAGAYDSTFGTEGIVSLGNFSPQRIYQQTDGKILAIGINTATSKTVIHRFLASGALDTTYGVAGDVSKLGTVDLPNDSYQIVPANSGKMFVVGTYSSISAKVFVFRLTSTGALDLPFGGGDGTVVVTPTYVHSDRYTLLADAMRTVEGRLLLGVTVGAVEPTSEVIRLTDNGALDNNFSGDGRVVVTGSGNLDMEIGRMTSDSAGRYLIWGDTKVIQLLSNGDYDTAFSTDGKVDFSNPLIRIQRVVPLPNQIDMLFGWDRAGIVWMRYRANGTQDMAVGTQRLLTPTNYQCYIRDAVRQPDGSCLVLGDGYDLNDPAHRSMFMFRVLADGTQDMSYGGSGMIVSSVYKDDFVNDALVMLNGNILLAQNQTPALDTSPTAPSGFFASIFSTSTSTIDFQTLDTTINVTGTDLAETIQARTEDTTLIIKAGTSVRRYRASDVTNINITAMAGDDVIDLSLANTTATISGGDGNDLIRMPVLGGYAIGDLGNDSMYGGNGNDSLTGSGGRDWMFGGNGSDRLSGGAGNDLMYGEAGNDRLYGGDGNDLLYGGANSDYLCGDAGDDYLEAYTGYDIFDGMAGNDTMVGSRGPNQFNGGDGLDLVKAYETGVDILNSVETIVP